MKKLIFIILFLISCQVDESCKFTILVKGSIYPQSTRGEALFKNGNRVILYEKYYEHGGQDIDLLDTVVTIAIFNNDRQIYRNNYHVKCNDLIVIE